MARGGLSPVLAICITFVKTCISYHNDIYGSTVLEYVYASNVIYP